MSQNRSVLKRVLDSARSTQNTWPYVGPTLAICGALLWGTAMVYASMYARLPSPTPSLKTWIIGLGAIAGLFIASGAFGSAKRHVLLWPPIFLGGLVAGGFLVWHFGVEGVTRMSDQAQQAFVDERRDFASSPSGFPYLASTARELWSVDVELNDSAGANAIDFGDSDASPAWSEVHRGFCVVNLAPRMTARFIGAAEAAVYRQDLWWVAVAREIGRCVDVSRDENGSAMTSGWSFKSLAPADAFGISTSHDYFLATKKESTRQWREHYADAFAVGWMRLARQDYSRQLADNLRHDQELAANGDGSADGACAITAALQTPRPTSLNDLPAWADRIRASSCPR